MSRKIFALLLLTALANCARYFEYHYISLEQIAGVEITTIGKSNYPNLRGNNAIPKEYVLKRDGYSLIFRILETVSTPHIDISVQGNSTTELSINPQERIQAVSAQGINCANSYSDATERSSFFFRWEDACIFERIPKYISLDVVGDNGFTIAEEDLEFQIKNNGWFLVIDGL